MTRERPIPWLLATLCACGIVLLVAGTAPGGASAPIDASAQLVAQDDEPEETETEEPAEPTDTDEPAPAEGGTTAEADPEAADPSIWAIIGAGLLIAFAVGWAVWRSTRGDDRDRDEAEDTRDAETGDPPSNDVADHR